MGRPWTLCPPPQGCCQHPHTPSAEGEVPPPCWSQQIRYQSPGPWSFRAAEIARARAAVTPGRRSRPQRTNTRQHAPRRAESLPELVKGTSPFQTDRRTWNHNPGCSEPSPGEAGLGRHSPQVRRELRTCMGRNWPSAAPPLPLHGQPLPSGALSLVPGGRAPRADCRGPEPSMSGGGISLARKPRSTMHAVHTITLQCQPSLSRWPMTIPLRHMCGLSDLGKG